ncbi:MAG TPA: hypothetical protein VFE63_01995 [Roseiarcus sp.]|nr:hypothetical protein [Roseiarcus sp.]
MALDEVALNPVRARLVRRAEDWPHSSVRAHLAGRDDGLVHIGPIIDRAPRFADLLEGEADSAAFVRSAGRSVWRALRRRSRSISGARSRRASAAASRAKPSCPG